MLSLAASFIMGIFLLPGLFITAAFFVKNLDDIIVNIIGGFWGAFLGLLAAYGLYLLQTKDAAKNEQTANLERKREHLRYFAGVMGDVVAYGRRQAEELEVFAAKLKSAPAAIHQLAIIASESVGRLNRADSESTFHAYNTIFHTEPNHEKEYKKMLSKTDLLTAELGAVKQSFKNYLDALYRHHLRLKDLVEKSSNETALLLREVRGNIPLVVRLQQQAPDAIEVLNDLLVTFNGPAMKGKPPEVYMAKFVEPLKQWLSIHDSWLPERGINLRIILRDSATVFTDLKHESINFAQAFNPEKLRGPLKEVTELQEKLSAGVEKQIKSV